MVAAHEANKGKRQHKAQVLWHGPYEIVSTLSPFVYICRLVGQDKTITVHVDRIKRFASKEFQMLPQLIHSAQSDAASFEVEKIVGWKAEEIRFFLKSNGLDMKRTITHMNTFTHFHMMYQPWSRTIFVA